MRLGVAASGGRDSTALLHCVLRQAAPLGVEVVALHVHHGLQPEADAWVEHLQAQVNRWARRIGPVRLRVARLHDRPAPGDSIEAWARRRRYEALAGLAREEDIGLVLLAQHRADQAETVLLQALRGGGPRGLAAMAPQFERHGLRWARPWLGQPRAAVESYLRRHRLTWVDDPSNAGPAFDRSRLRERVMPALVAAFPPAEAALARTAREMAHADAALRDWAARDLVQVSQGDALDVAAWRRLSAPRARFVMREWLIRQGAAEAPDTLLDRLVDELGVDGDAPTAPGAAPGPAARSPRGVGRWPLPGGEIRLFRGLLQRFVATTPARARRTTAPAAVAIDLSRPGAYAVPGWAGAWMVEPTHEAGLPAELLARATCLPRQGGETFQRTPGGTRRALKKQFQAAGVPPWSREAPLLWSGPRLLFVPGLGADAGALREAVAPPLRNLRVQWMPEAPGAGRVDAGATPPVAGGRAQSPR